MSPDIKFQINTATGKTTFSEQDIADATHSSAIPWIKARELLHLPANVHKKKILDIGAGASDITAHFLDAGAEAYALDPKYSNPAALVNDYKATLTTEFYDHQNIEIILDSIKKFEESIKANPDKYLAKLASNLPFKDKYLDLVMSINAVMGYLDIDREILQRVMNECLRVTKPDGRIIFTPFQNVDPTQDLSYNQFRLENDKKILNFLRGSRAVKKVSIITSSFNNHNVLEVIKAK